MENKTAFEIGVISDTHGVVDALALKARRERYLALEVQGQRHNIGVKYGLLMAQLALTLDGDDREEILAQLIELLAMRERCRHDR